jgi:ADP-heptose:LPS heptosyltransferase
MNATSRMWAADRFGAVAMALDREGFGIVLVGGPSSEDRRRVDEVRGACPAVDTLDLCGRTTLGGLGAVLRQVRLLITGDVGLMHIGSAARVPMLVLAGASDTDHTGPWTAGDYRVLREPVACAPCVRNTCGNHEAPMICMESISVDRVVRAAMETLLTPGRE